MTDWRTRMYCAGHDSPDWWSEDAVAGYGVHACLRHCPVIDQCRAQQERWPQAGVYAGEFWVQTQQRGRITSTKQATHQPKELWCAACQLSSAVRARQATIPTVAEAPSATVSIGVSDAA